MTNKSKSYVTEPKIIAQEYYDALSSILDACNTMMNNSNNHSSEIFRISSIISFFAGQKAYLDKLRMEFSRAKKNKDVQGVKNLMYKIENNIECKAFDDFWSEASQMYDAMIASVQQENTNDNISLIFKTSEEILEGRRQYFIEQEQSKFDEQIKAVEYMLNI